ncbi:hypothetical protein QE152_g35848 [Popillia japonica]|uniref:Uncharacterized protein n=1 Tax=Popillia japonica TaxID=7064 RepID=A0AAW1IEW3_POPJA
MAASWSNSQRLAAARIFALALPVGSGRPKGGGRVDDGDRGRASPRKRRPGDDVWWVTAGEIEKKARPQNRVPHSYDSESATVVRRSGTSEYEYDDDDYDLDDARDDEV